jgi:TolB-like protein/Tfp pilus assembly protein PilF
MSRNIWYWNILLSEEGKVKLTDFGLAKLRGTIHKTKTGSTLGTVSYMSPEQIRGEEVDQRTDLFSLGVVLYELLTSHLPFAGEYEAAVTYAILNDDPQKIRSLRAEVPAELEKIIERCLEKDKTKRYQQAEEIISELQVVQQKSSRTIQVEKKRARLPLYIVMAITLLALIALGYFFFKPKTTPVQEKSIAVLPFKNLSDSKQDEYFSDGITDDIIAQLSKISELKVISRTSVMQYKETSKNIRQIGQELDVGTVLEGSVRHVGNQVRIVAQLIDARNEGHLWADTYDKEMTQIFAVQSDVAQKIANALQAKLAPEELKRIEKKQTENTEAYELYLKGRFYWNKRTSADLQKAIVYFNQAVEKDPTYALAYAGLADSYVLLPDYLLPAREYFQKAREATAKALELDSSLAEVHTVLGNVKTSQFDWKDAEKEYKRAIELNPSYPTAHHWYSMLLSILGRPEEALAESRRALKLDPLSLIISLNFAINLYETKQYDQATDQCNKVIELDPNFPWSYYVLGLVAEVQGKFDEAIGKYQQARILSHNDPTMLGEIGRSSARAGRRKAALMTLHELHEYSKQGYSVSFAIGQIYYGLGDKEKTFEWLEQSFQNKESAILDLKRNPIWDGIRSDPRFIALLKKMGLEK